MTVKEIIKGWLIKNNYNGLYNEECGCFLYDLIPCCENCADCIAGHTVLLEEGGFGIGLRKEVLEDELVN